MGRMACTEPQCLYKVQFTYFLLATTILGTFFVLLLDCSRTKPNMLIHYCMRLKPTGGNMSNRTRWQCACLSPGNDILSLRKFQEPHSLPKYLELGVTFSELQLFTTE